MNTYHKKLEQYQDNLLTQFRLKLTISVTHQPLQMKWLDADLY